MNKNLYRYFLLIPFILALTLTSCGDDNDDSNNSGPPTGGPVIYMWVSTTTTTGNIGGYDGANKICEQDAAGITFPTGMAFHKALLPALTKTQEIFLTAICP